jgi:hypothetical protein
VDVDGGINDVAFDDGACTGLFANCDQGSDFTFGPTNVILASQALIDQVFLNSALGQFDAEPGLIAGCEGISACGAIVPYSIGFGGTTFNAYMAVNSPGSVADQNNPTTIASNTDTTTVATWVFARFSRPITVAPGVPEPSTWAMMMLGFGMIAFRMRRRSQPGALSRQRLLICTES